MTAFQAGADYGDGRREEARGPAAIVLDHSHPASKRIIVGYGFWIFLLSDIIMFSAFFATYAVLSGETAGGPSGKDLFDLHNVAIETGCLLLSSFTCGLAAIGARAHNGLMYYGGMAATCVLGLGFLAIEIHEFVGMIDQGAGPHAECVPLRVLHPGRLPRRARHPWNLVAAHHDRAGVRQGLSRRHSAPRPLLRAVLAYARHHLGGDLHGRLSFGSRLMSSIDDYEPLRGADHAPGDEPARGREVLEGVLGYLVGLALAILLTAVSFFLAGTWLVWRPSIPIALVVLAIAQIGVHLVFFLHITTGPDNVNNVLALAFGVLIVMLIMVGSLWIMSNMNNNMTPMHMQMGQSAVWFMVA